LTMPLRCNGFASQRPIPDSMFQGARPMMDKGQ
jgi:hypothetical protein